MQHSSKKCAKRTQRDAFCVDSICVDASLALDLLVSPNAAMIYEWRFAIFDFVFVVVLVPSLGDLFAQKSSFLFQFCQICSLLVRLCALLLFESFSQTQKALETKCLASRELLQSLLVLCWLAWRHAPRVALQSRVQSIEAWIVSDLVNHCIAGCFCRCLQATTRRSANNKQQTAEQSLICNFKFAFCCCARKFSSESRIRCLLFRMQFAFWLLSSWRFEHTNWIFKYCLFARLLKLFLSLISAEKSPICVPFCKQNYQVAFVDRSTHDRMALLCLLQQQIAANRCDLLRSVTDDGTLFAPLTIVRLTINQAHFWEKQSRITRR